MKDLKGFQQLSRSELRNIVGGFEGGGGDNCLFHYYCDCVNGVTSNGSASSFEEAAQTCDLTCQLYFPSGISSLGGYTTPC